jgi:hypothetical protein
MRILNETNGAHKTVFKFAERALADFTNPVGVVMGIAYGGEVEEIAKIWKGRGTIYGYDTFEDLHPQHVFKGGEKDAFEANCMEHWYKTYGTQELSYDYQR